MAINFLDRITVNSGTGSASTIVAAGTRPITLTGGGIGSVAIGGSSGGWATGYFFTGSSGTNRGGFGALGNTDALSYYYIGDAYNDTTMVVQPNAGNVGIGTTAPVDKLHVSSGMIRVEGVGSGIRMPDTSGNPLLALTTDQNTFAGCNIVNGWSNSSNTGVGVGTTRSDGTAFQVRTGITLSSGIGTNSGTTRFIVNGNGNVGIGTTAPAEKLDVAGTIKTTGQIQVTPTSGYGTIEIGGPSGGFIDLKGPSTDDYDLRIISGGSGGSFFTGGYGHVMTLNSSGNVGIGTTSPAEKLDVNGNVKATGYKTSSGTGVTTNVTVRNQNNSGTRTFQIVSGIIVGVT